MKRSLFIPDCKKLSAVLPIEVRFSEVDSMGIVWHGNYPKYLEDGRENFGKKYGTDYMSIFNKHALMVPIVHMQLSYKKQLFYGESALLTTTFCDHPAAKICFQYELRSVPDKQLILTAETIQVFMDTDRRLVLNTPPFLKNGK